MCLYHIICNKQNHTSFGKQSKLFPVFEFVEQKLEYSLLTLIVGNCIDQFYFGSYHIITNFTTFLLSNINSSLFLFHFNRKQIDDSRCEDNQSLFLIGKGSLLSFRNFPLAKKYGVLSNN